MKLTRDSMSALASVVSEGSPGSSFVWDRGAVVLPLLRVDGKEDSDATIDRVRGRFVGGGALLLLLLLGVEEDSTCFLVCLTDDDVGAAESSPSSPEASREDGWSRSVVED